MTPTNPQMCQSDWNDIEYSCSQVQDLCGPNGLLGIFSLRFMHEYTTFTSFDALLQMINKKRDDVTDVADLVALDTPDSDTCIAAYSEFGSWQDFVTTACVFFLSGAADVPGLL